MELDVRKNKKHCVFALIGGKVTGFYRFLKGFHGLSELPTIFQEKMDQTLKFKTPAWIDDMNNSNSRRKIRTHIASRRNINRIARSRLSCPKRKKNEFCLKKTVGLGHHISKNGIKPNEEKTLPITNLDHPRNPKELKIISRCIAIFFNSL